MFTRLKRSTETDDAPGPADPTIWSGSHSAACARSHTSGTLLRRSPDPLPIPGPSVGEDLGQTAKGSGEVTPSVRIEARKFVK